MDSVHTMTGTERQSEFPGVLPGFDHIVGWVGTGCTEETLDSRKGGETEDLKGKRQGRWTCAVVDKYTGYRVSGDSVVRRDSWTWVWKTRDGTIKKRCRTKRLCTHK